MYSMWKKGKQVFQDNQPIQYTGVITHTMGWITSRTNDYIYQNPNYEPTEEQEPFVIYCVHGTADQPSAFSRISKYLIKNGLPQNLAAIYQLSFSKRYQGAGIELFAQELIEKIKANNHKKVILLGHSRGGIVCAYAAEYLALESEINVKMVISICAPFKGSPLALAPLTMLSTSVNQMQMDSQFLEKLAEKIKNTSLKYHFYTVENDGIVAKDAAHVAEYVQKNPNSLTVLDRHGHLSVMSSKRIKQSIYNLISECVNPPHVTVTLTRQEKVLNSTIVEEYEVNLSQSSKL